MKKRAKIRTRSKDDPKLVHIREQKNRKFRARVRYCPYLLNIHRKDVCAFPPPAKGYPRAKWRPSKREASNKNKQYGAVLERMKILSVWGVFAKVFLRNSRFRNMHNSFCEF